MTPPNIDQSTREERRDYVQKAWQCMHNCELCGKCHMLHGRMAEELYSDYIEGVKTYMDVTLEIRRNKA